MQVATDYSQSHTHMQLLIDTVAQYTQEASHCIHMKLFRVKMSLKNEKSGKIEHREVIMLHRLDVQRLSGKKHSEWVGVRGSVVWVEMCVGRPIGLVES